MIEQIPLFPIDPPRKTARETTVARYARCRPRGRTHCGDCTLAIHQQGIAVAPFPRSVRWRRTCLDGEITYLCEQHKDERQENEKK